MGKKNGSKSSNRKEKGSRYHNDEDDDIIAEDYLSMSYGEDRSPVGVDSGLGEISLTPPPFDEVKTSSFDIGEAVDMLTEKKVNLREPALLSIIAHLRSSGRSATEFNHLQSYLETLTSNATRFLRRPGSLKEGVLACQILCLLSLYNGPNDRMVLNASEKPLLQLIDRSVSSSEGSDNNELRCWALFTYCFLIFLDENDEKIHETLTFLQNILVGESPFDQSNDSLDHGGVVTYTQELKAKAIDCWVFLASHLSEDEVLESARDSELFETITSLMDNSFNDINMKVSAGRAIAFLWETAHNSQEDLSFEELGNLLCYNPRIVDEALTGMSFSRLTSFLIACLCTLALS
jgi:hypothetical protein